MRARVDHRRHVLLRRRLLAASTHREGRMNPNQQNPSITFTPMLLERLKRDYALAVAAQRDTFMFDGHALLTEYAKYLIEYLESRFGGRP
jgi:hypothetical protein